MDQDLTNSQAKSYYLQNQSMGSEALPEENMLKLDIKAQLFLIKTLWGELVDYHRVFEVETFQLIERLRGEMEAQITLKTPLNDPFSGQFSQLLAQKDETIGQLLSELEKLNTFVVLMQEKATDAPQDDLISDLKGLLSGKELEIITLNEKIRDFEGVIGFTSQNLHEKERIIEELTEKNRVLEEKTAKIGEISDEKHRVRPMEADVDTPFFKDDGEGEIPINRMEKEKKAGKNVKFSFGEHPNAVKNEDKEAFEPEKKKFLEEIKRLKEKIYNLNIERENLIWTESNAIKQLQSFQLENDKKRLKTEAKPAQDTPKAFKKSHTINIAEVSGGDDRLQEERLITQLREILGEIAFL